MLIHDGAPWREREREYLQQIASNVEPIVAMIVIEWSWMISFLIIVFFFLDPNQEWHPQPMNLPDPPTQITGQAEMPVKAPVSG